MKWKPTYGVVLADLGVLQIVETKEYEFDTYQ
jgi:hypothetical protein